MGLKMQNEFVLLNIWLKGRTEGLSVAHVSRDGCQLTFRSPVEQPLDVCQADSLGIILVIMPLVGIITKQNNMHVLTDHRSCP